MLHFFVIVLNVYIFNRKMESLKQHLEQCYNNDYTGLSTEVREIALEYSRLCLLFSQENGLIHENAAQHIHLLQLLAAEIDRLGKP